MHISITEFTTLTTLCNHKIVHVLFFWSH